MYISDLIGKFFLIALISIKIIYLLTSGSFYKLFLGNTDHILIKFFQQFCIRVLFTNTDHFISTSLGKMLYFLTQQMYVIRPFEQGEQRSCRVEPYNSNIFNNLISQVNNSFLSCSFCLISLASNILKGWDILHLKGEIHSSVWSTKTFLYNIRALRYMQNIMWYQIYLKNLN